MNDPSVIIVHQAFTDRPWWWRLRRSTNETRKPSENTVKNQLQLLRDYARLTSYSE